MTDKNYKPANYSVEIELVKSPDDVFKHVIDLSKWWPEKFEGENIKLDTEFVFKTGDSHYSKNKVIEFVPDKKVVWVTTESIRKTDNYDWTGTKFIFELTPKGNSTLLKFTYDGVVLESESDRLIQICDMTIKEFFYNFITNGRSDRMIQKDFSASIELEKSSEDVFKAITHDVAKWWGSGDLKGDTTKLNDEFVVHHPGAHYSKQQLVELIPDKKVVWLVTESELSWLKDTSEWTGTRMIFELTPEGNKTQLRFTHEGLVPEKECYDRCAQGWEMVIKEWLVNFITDGKAI
jgi:uncharacterized protein YndB with AHSA1/START domain